MKVLLTGFEPFGGDEVNESWEAVRAVPSRIGSDLDVRTARLPVAFDAGLQECRRLVDHHAPDVVVLVGLAAGAEAIRLERVAINVIDARIADNRGASPVDEPVVPGGPAAYFSTLPLKAVAGALRDAGLPALVSNSAGTYVCNASFYAVQHHLADRPEVRSGFVHVPRDTVVDIASLGAAIRCVAETTARVARGELVEPRTAAGTEH